MLEQNLHHFSGSFTMKTMFSKFGTTSMVTEKTTTNAFFTTSGLWKTSQWFTFHVFIFRNPIRRWQESFLEWINGRAYGGKGSLRKHRGFAGSKRKACKTVLEAVSCSSQCPPWLDEPCNRKVWAGMEWNENNRCCAGKLVFSLNLKIFGDVFVSGTRRVSCDLQYLFKFKRDVASLILSQVDSRYVVHRGCIYFHDVGWLQVPESRRRLCVHIG